MNLQFEWVAKHNYPSVHLNARAHGNKRPTGLNLPSILTSTIVWGGLQGLSIRQYAKDPDTPLWQSAAGRHWVL